MPKNLDGIKFKYPKWYKPNDGFYTISKVALREVMILRKTKKLGHPSQLGSIKEWNLVLDNIIFYLKDSLDLINTDKFYKGKYKTEFRPLPNGCSELVFLEKPKLINKKGLTSYENKVKLGKQQFFEFFENLWD